MQIVNWINNYEAKNKKSNGLGGMGGFFATGMRWKDYLEIFIKEVHPQLEVLRKSILENKIKFTGQEMQRDNTKTVPLWDDGTVTHYTWRSWGDLMAAVWSEEENKNYNYLDFYM